MKSRIIAGVDLGTTKVSCVVGQATPSGELEILGTSLVPCRGVPQGIVSDLPKTIDAVSAALVQAEEEARTKVHACFANLSGAHLLGHRSHGVVNLEDHGSEITQRDLERVIASAKAIAVPFDRQIIHMIDQGYAVDGQQGIKDPLGMFGARLEVELYLVTGLTTMTQNVRKSIEANGLAIEGLVVSGLATAQAVLTEQERQLGVILVDVGGSVSELVAFVNGVVTHLEIFPWGGDELTIALKEALRIPFEEAEAVKKRYGRLDPQAIPEDEKVIIQVNGKQKGVSLREIAKTLHDRWHRIVKQMAHQMEEAELLSHATAGVVFTGSSLLLEGAIEAAEPIIQQPIRMGTTRSLKARDAEVYHPSYATAIGLLRYGIESHRRRVPPALTSRQPIARLIARLQHLFQDYF